MVGNYINTMKITFDVNFDFNLALFWNKVGLLTYKKFKNNLIDINCTGLFLNFKGCKKIYLINEVAIWFSEVKFEWLKLLADFKLCKE